MKNERPSTQQTHSVQTLFLVILLFLFAVSSLVLIALGASVYRNNIRALSANSGARTAHAYVTEKIRQADVSGSVSCGAFPAKDASDALPSLIFAREENGTSYLTYLYVHDGSLKELTVREGTTLSPNAGQRILPANSLTITQDPAQSKLYYVTVETAADGADAEQQILLYLKSDPLQSAATAAEDVS